MAIFINNGGIKFLENHLLILHLLKFEELQKKYFLQKENLHK